MGTRGAVQAETADIEGLVFTSYEEVWWWLPRCQAQCAVNQSCCRGAAAAFALRAHLCCLFAHGAPALTNTHNAQTHPHPQTHSPRTATGRTACVHSVLDCAA